jgi:hypothetical protein
MKKIIFSALLALSTLSSSQAANLYSSNLGNGIARVGNNTGFPTGTVRFGIFPDNFDFATNSEDYTALDSAFTQVYSFSGDLQVAAADGFYQTAHVYDETASFEGTPYSGIEGKKVYVWILNDTDPTLAGQQAIFSTNSVWVSASAPVKDTFVTPDSGAPGLTAHLGGLANGANVGAGAAAHTGAGAAEAISGVVIARINGSGPVLEGGSATLRMDSVLTGSFPATYQWFKDGDLLVGETNRQLDLTNTLLGDAGSYSVKVSNALSEDVESNSLALTVVTPTPTILEEPKSAVVAVGAPLVFSVSAVGAGTLTYQWKKGADLPGATAANLSMGNATLAQAGAYSVLVSNAAGKVNSTAAELTVVNTTPVVIANPVGSKAVLRAIATGKNATFQWFRGNTRIISTAKFVGGTTSTLTINSVTSQDSGIYTCRVSAPGLSTFVVAGANTLRVFSSAPILPSGPSLNMPLTGRIGSTYSFQIPLDPSGGAATKFAATNLPPGITVNTTTGLISGRPTKAGTYNVVLGASNGFLPNAVSSAQALVISAFPENVAGTYVGPVDRSPDLGASLGGRIQLTVTATGGITTGSLVLGGVTSPIVGNIETTATGAAATLTVNRAGGLTPLILSFSIANNLLSDGTITDGTLLNPIEFEGWRNVWTPTTTAAAYVGRYNLSLTPTNSADLTDIAKPNGTSFASIDVAANGTVKFTGSLADGTPIAGSSVLGPNGEVFFFQTMYLKTKLGSLIGGLMINSLSDANVSNNTITAGDCDWNRPENLTATNRLYRSGFDPMALSIDGGFYAAPTGSTLLLGLTDGTNNALVTLLNGGLTTPPTTTVSVRTGNVLTPAATNALAITTVPALGTFTGSFTIVPFAKTNYFGLIVPMASVQNGVGYFILNQSSAPTSAQRSGSVRFARP